VAGGWRRLHNEEFQNYYASAYISRVVKSITMLWPGPVAGMGEMINA
jgi:hypothetical protein